MTMHENTTHGTISSAILVANLPTLVPPYFCTSHRAAGSPEFWCSAVGVWGPRDDIVDGVEVEERVGDGGG